MRYPQLRGTLAERGYIVDMFVDFLYGENATEDMAELIGCGWDVLDERYIVVSPTVVYSGEICSQWDGGDYVHFDRVMCADEEARSNTETEFLLSLPDAPEEDDEPWLGPRRKYRTFIIGRRVSDNEPVLAIRAGETGTVLWTTMTPDESEDLLGPEITDEAVARYRQIKADAAPDIVDITDLNAERPPNYEERRRTIDRTAELRKKGWNND